MYTTSYVGCHLVCIIQNMHHLSYVLILTRVIIIHINTVAILAITHMRINVPHLDIIWVILLLSK